MTGFGKTVCFEMTLALYDLLYNGLPGDRTLPNQGGHAKIVLLVVSPLVSLMDTASLQYRHPEAQKCFALHVGK